MTVQDLLDREAIREVLARYAQGLDRRDFEQVASCFTANAEAEYSGKRLDPGVENIVAHVRGVERLQATTHFTGSSVIELRGESADVETYLIAHLVYGGRIRVRGLRYNDVFVRTEAGWRIRRRRHQVDWMYVADTAESL